MIQSSDYVFEASETIRFPQEKKIGVVIVAAKRTTIKRYKTFLRKVVP